MGKRGPKPTAEHGTHTRYRRGCKCEKCRAAHSAYVRDWYARNPEKKREQYLRRQARLTPEDHKRWNLARYGLTVEAFEALWLRQKGACAVCKKAMVRAKRGPRVVCVDHCHNSQAVRGLLCGSCNRALGLLGEDPKVLARASRYLARGLTA